VPGQHLQLHVVPLLRHTQKAWQPHVNHPMLCWPPLRERQGAVRLCGLGCTLWDVL
jgi:hypothetical protein